MCVCVCLCVSKACIKAGKQSATWLHKHRTSLLRTTLFLFTQQRRRNALVETVNGSV